ncbi:MAG: hypothetical protein PHT77_05525 [Bacteroidales bacterium]|nr:hypothetical protein [Bacteroidales bacterium]
MNFIKARYRRMGSKADGPPVIDIDGIEEGTTFSIHPGTAYALRDALSAALDDYERDNNVR